MLKKLKSSKELLAPFRLNHSKSKQISTSPVSVLRRPALLSFSRKQKRATRHLKSILCPKIEDVQGSSKQLREKPKTLQMGDKKSMYEGFSIKDKSSIQKALEIMKVREKKKLKGQVFLKPPVAREQADKNKNIFLLGISTQLIEQKKFKLKTRQANSWKTLYRFQKKMNEYNQSVNLKFQNKKQEMDQTLSECISKTDQKNRVIEDIRKKGTTHPSIFI